MIHFVIDPIPSQDTFVDMPTLKILGSRILVRPMPQKERDGSIFLDHNYQDDRKRWEVIDVGPKTKDIKPGDKVIVHGNVESLFEWTDGVQILNAKDAVAVF